jgi:preprotein translocase subunit SecG
MSEAFGGGAAQSLFGGRVATVMTKLTAGCAIMFMVTCLSLAYLSSVRGRSVIDQIPDMGPGSIPPMLPAVPAPSSVALPDTGSAPETQIPNNTPGEAAK